MVGLNNIARDSPPQKLRCSRSVPSDGSAAATDCIRRVKAGSLSIHSPQARLALLLGALGVSRTIHATAVNTRNSSTGRNNETGNTTIGSCSTTESTLHQPGILLALGRVLLLSQLSTGG
ncbi:uncharacterized protein G6M90_00g113880 [Metarhizium brunneum]|uniref:Uncharacterized protein n=1 Tax=Metarhizium brunneum TaxID=500148 RepID=A0A7D5ZCF3_9HYPO|nr:hypothetical protein G6M90_00g113880 [Metarhizium brunneum]